MSRSFIILRNIASNWLGFVVNAAVTLVLTPYVLSELGVARYGVWIFTSSVIGYYGFLDLGFRAGVTQYITRYLALQDYEKASDSLSSAVAALSMLGVVMVPLSFGTAYIVPHIFTIPPGMEKETFWCILVVGISSAVQCAFSSFSTMFTAMQRYDLANMIGIGTRLLTAGGIVIALKTGQGLIGISVAFCGANAIDYLIRWRFALSLVPELDVTWRRVRLLRLREMASFGAWNFLASVNQYICVYVPNILIGAFMPIAAVGHYALAIGLYRQVSSMLSPVAQVMYPAAAAMYAQDDMKGLESLYHHGSRLMMLVMIPAVLGAMFWAEDFYRLWIGETYLSGSPFQSVALLFNILMIGMTICLSTSIAQQILVGAGRVRQVSLALIAGSAINLILSFILIRIYGLAGITIAIVIASVLIDLIAMPLMLQRILKFSVIAFLRNSCARPMLAGFLQALLMMFIRLLDPAENFFQLAFQGILAGSSAIVVLYYIGLTQKDKQRFVIEPMRRIYKKKKLIFAAAPKESNLR